MFTRVTGTLIRFADVNKTCIGMHRCLASATSSHTKKTKLFRELDGQVDTQSNEFKSNVEQSAKVRTKYNEMLQVAFSGGGPKGIARHVDYNKKMLATERLSRLLDDDTDFLEIAPFAGLHMEYGNIPRAGIIAGIGRIHGLYCMLFLSDATVKGGTLYPIAVKKQIRAQEIAMDNELPCVHVVDSGGAFLPLQADIFPDKEHGGRTFYNEAVSSGMGIPQMAIVVGNCTAGGAYVPTMAQEALIVHRIGTIFLGGPPLVYAALGEVVSAEDLGGATMHCSVSGCTDHFSGTEEEAYETSRDIVATFNAQGPILPGGFEEPVFDSSELDGIIPKHNQHTLNIYQVLARIVDGSRFQEFKAMYGPTIVTGFAHIQGHLVGLVGNCGEITAEAGQKASHFVQLCSQRNIPLVFLQNTAPVTSPPDTVEQAELLSQRIRAHAQMMSAVACAQVPKVTVVIGNSIGTDNYLMCGRSFSPNFMFSWPNAKVAMVEDQLIEDAVIQSKFPKGVDKESETYLKFKEKVLDNIPLQTSAFFASSRIWDDGVILPQDTRKVLGQCLRILSQPGVCRSNKHAVMRM